MMVKRKLNVDIKTLIGYVLVICIAVLRATQFHVERGDNMDLARHMYMMEVINMSDYSLLEYVFLYGDAFTSNITMKFCYAFNIIVYIIAKYCNNYYIISWLFVFVDYSIIAYMGLDWWKNYGGRKGYMFLFEILICFSLLPFFQAVSGLRTAMAACLTALAIYLYLVRDKSLLVFFAVSVLAATVHPVFMIAVPFAVLAKIADGKKGLLITVVGSVSVPLIANICIKIPNDFLYGIAFKYLQYTGEDGYRSTRFCYYGVIVICFLVIVQYFLNSMHKSPQNEKTLDSEVQEIMPSERIYHFVIYYMIFILSNIGKYEMVLRPAYLLGALAPVISGMVFSGRHSGKERNILPMMILLPLFAVVLYVSIKYLFWHSEYFM